MATCATLLPAARSAGPRSRETHLRRCFASMPRLKLSARLDLDAFHYAISTPARATATASSRETRFLPAYFCRRNQQDGAAYIASCGFGGQLTTRLPE